MPRRIRFLTRLWFYFRIGYATYLTFLLGAVNTLVVVWYLAIRDIPLVEDIFGHFAPFAIFVTIVGVPLSIAVGWVHYKRSPAYTSEIDIQIEANPYNYKLIPGKERELYGPLYLEMLQLMRKLLQAQHLMSSADESAVDTLESKLRVLVEGGFVGSSKART